MITSYRRDTIAKSLFRFSEILFGASLVSVWSKQELPAVYKLAFGLGVVVVFTTASAFTPAHQPGKGT